MTSEDHVISIKLRLMNIYKLSDMHTRDIYSNIDELKQASIIIQLRKETNYDLNMYKLYIIYIFKVLPS